MGILPPISNLRFVLPTETDDGSPDNETTYTSVLQMIESLFLLMLDTGESGTVSTATATVLSDTGASRTADAQIGRTLVLTDNLGIAEAYPITDNASQSVTVTGDLVADGIAIGDEYRILYDVLSSFRGHNHDGKNSKLNTGTINQTALKTSLGEVSTAGTANLTLPGGQYGLYPQVKGDFASFACFVTGNIGGTYVTNIYMVASAGTIYAQQRYITASGEVHWIYLLKDKRGKTIATYQAPDHPCFGNGNRPALVQHPFSDVYFDSGKMLYPVPGSKPIEVEMLVINPSMDQVKDATARCLPVVGGGYLTARKLANNKYKIDADRPERSLIEVFETDFDVLESKQADWPDMPITVGLPRVVDGKIMGDYRFKEGQEVTPLRRIIKKPDFITPLSIKLR